MPDGDNRVPPWSEKLVVALALGLTLWWLQELGGKVEALEAELHNLNREVGEIGMMDREMMRRLQRIEDQHMRSQEHVIEDWRGSQ